jgi:hypothetical protein
VFQPIFTITPKLAQALMRIEAAKQSVADLPITAKVQARLRETAPIGTSQNKQIETHGLISASEALDRQIEISLRAKEFLH